MRPSNKQRSRNKPGNNGNQHNQQRRPNMGNIINRVFESAGPDGKVRGTPQQIIDKYQALARDAQLAGDRVTAENYLQHSEHYSRLLGEAQRQQAETRFNQERDDGQRGGDEGQPQPQQQPQRPDDGYDQQRRQPAPVASGLTMIDPDDSFDLAGPIETPEDRRARFHEATPAPAPVVQPAPMQPATGPANGAEHSAAADGASEPPAKRSRPRRRAKPEAAPEPVSQAE